MFYKTIAVSSALIAFYFACALETTTGSILKPACFMMLSALIALFTFVRTDWCDK